MRGMWEEVEIKLWGESAGEGLQSVVPLFSGSLQHNGDGRVVAVGIPEVDKLCIDIVVQPRRNQITVMSLAGYTGEVCGTARHRPGRF